MLDILRCPMKCWFWVCDIGRYHDLWEKWKEKGVATLGWPPDCSDDENYRRRLDYNLRQVERMEKGDRIVAYLKQHRIGGIGTFEKGIDRRGWTPVSGDDQGRRARVIWDTLPKKGCYSLAPEGAVPQRMPTVRRIGSSRKFSLIETAVTNPDSWEPLSDSRLLVQDERKELHPLIEKNLGSLEEGLKPNPWGSMREFPAKPIGSIDFLCVDASDCPVVIEAKAYSADDSSIGQICRYMSWVRLRIRGGGEVRGFLIAGEFSPKVRYAASDVKGLELFRYEVRDNRITFRRVENKREELQPQMGLPETPDLPFFTYGLFKPDQLGYFRLRDFVHGIDVGCTTRGMLLERDGLPIIDGEGSGVVKGCLLHFQEDSRRAYGRIVEMEPGKQYRWGEAEVIAGETSQAANILFGRSPDRGSVRPGGEEWDGRKDPMFAYALKIVQETLEENRDHEQGGIKALLRLQMAYLLLWSAIERYVTLRYHLGRDVHAKVMNLAQEETFRESLQDVVSATREVYRADNPTKRVSLDPSNPRKSLAYYYQIRSNVTHRGKSVWHDFDLLKESLGELLEIFRRVKDKAFEEREDVPMRRR